MQFKTFIFLLCLALASFSSLSGAVTATSSYIVEGVQYEGAVLVNTDACTIIALKNPEGEGKNPLLFWVLGQIASEVAIEAGREICVQMAGEENQEICNAVADGISLVSGLRGIGKGVTRVVASGALKYWAEKKIENKTLNFLTQTYEMANNVKDVIDAYKNLRIVNWQRVAIGQGEAQYTSSSNLYTGDIYLKNNTVNNLSFSISHDGHQWTPYVLGSGYINNYFFWNGKQQQSYGFIKINDCIFQMKCGGKYKINYNQGLNTYDIKFY